MPRFPPRTLVLMLLALAAFVWFWFRTHANSQAKRPTEVIIVPLTPPLDAGLAP